MSWGIDFTADIFLSRQSYSGKDEVQDKIRELDELITDCEGKLKMYATATPRDIISPDGSEDPINWISQRINEELELYREYLIDRFKLDLYLEYLNTNNG